ncbi:MAG TPA: efflux RND transporter periplasmic adaptor subunit [Vicinamibacterales bacterium]|nr:efflux RND transporter periplasmic adaptor subunit [Acidobacteriota bacterium]HOC16769.1 efflux RND transporter periplasmic adaptor subunit [Vicinamibacterales bacterium]
MARARGRKLLGIAAAVVVLGCLGVYGYTVLAKPASAVDPSRVVAVERGDLARSVVATGKIEPIAKVEIKSKANGIIKELRVDVGDTVRAGQVLAELDRDNLAARLREAQAALAGAQANLEAAEAELAKNRVEAEGPQVAFARRNLERADQLAREKLISTQALDDARSALEQAENQQRVARSQLGVSRARVAQAHATVAQAKAAAERAAEELDNATIRSPIDAVVLSRDVEVGSPVSSILNLGSAATLVMVLGDMSTVYVRGRVDEADVGLVKLGQPARIRVETFKDRPFEGRVTQIAPMGVEKDNVVNFEVRVSIDNASGELRANMTSNAEIVLEEHAGTLVIPEAAVVYDASREASVEVVSDSAPNGRERRPITTGLSNGTKTEVLKGLKEGDRVILQ